MKHCINRGKWWKKFLTVENQIFGLKIMVVLFKLMKEIMKIMTQMMKKKEKACLKSRILKFFDVIPLILILIFLICRQNKLAHIKITRKKQQMKRLIKLLKTLKK